MVALVTPRLTLRKPKAGDVSDLHACMSDPRAMRYWTRPEHETVQETQAFLDAMMASDLAGGDEFVIVHDRKVIGKAGMWRRWEVGFLLHPDYWGMGLAQEAMTALIAHLTRCHETRHLTAEADPRNTASLALLDRLGFRETHRATQTMQWRDEWCDSVYLRLDLPQR